MSDPADQTEAVHAPPVVAEHELLRRIGVGAYGEVWLARSVMGMLRAVKVIWRDRFEHERIYEREFTGLRHFEPLSRSHPGLVDVLQVGRSETHGHFYYVMELADHAGEETAWRVEQYAPLTLGTLLQAKGALPVVECARIGADVAAALSFLHQRGLVHRDVKPSNLIFVGGQPKLADLGLVAGLNAAQSFVGTEGYIPPEGPGSPQSDLYGLGKVLYEMATGQNRLDFPELPPDWQDRDETDLFAELNETILRACAPDAADRHASAEAVRTELLLIQAGQSVRRLHRNERILTRWRRLGTVAVLLGLVSLGATWFTRDQTARANRRATAEAALRERIEDQERRIRMALYSADMNLAQQAIQAGNYGRAEELLDAYRPQDAREDLRGFEWFHFWDRVTGDARGVLRGHDQLIVAVRVSRDGRRLYSASYDGTLREWSLDGLHELQRWEFPGSILRALSEVSEGGLLAVELDQPPRTVVLNLTGGGITNRSPGSPSVVFSPEADRLLRANRMVLFETNAATEIVNARSLEVEQVLDQSGGRAWFAPGGRLLVTGPWDRSLRLWSWPELEPMGELAGAGTVMGVAFSPDGSRLACVSRQGLLQLWNLATQRRLAESSAHQETVVWDVAWSPDGARLATAGNDQTVRLWDAATLAEVHVFRGHGSEVWSVEWTPDGGLVVSAGKDNTIRLWDGEPDPAALELEPVGQTPAFSPDERLLAVRLQTGDVRVLDPSTGREVLALGPAVELGGFVEDGSAITLLRPGGTVEWRDSAGGALLEAHRLDAGWEPAPTRVLAPSGRWLVAGDEDGTVRVYDVRSGGPPRPLDGHTGRIFSLAISPDGRRLLSGSRDFSTRLWELDTGREIRVFRGHQMSISALEFEPAGGRIATGSWDDTARLWDAASGEALAVYGAHSTGVHAVALAPDGRTLAVLTGGSELKFWNLATGREAGVLQFDRGIGLGRLRFSPSGQWLAVVSPPGRLALLPAPRPDSTGGPGFR